MQTCLLIPAYNAERYLGVCLSSVDEFDKVIVWDDGSTDNTKAIAESFFPFVDTYSGSRQGVQIVRNLLFDLSKGYDYIAYLDADDARIPNALELQLNQLAENNHLSVLFSPVMLSPKNQLTATEPDPIKSVLKRSIQTGSMLFKRPALKALQMRQGYIWDESVPCMHENHLIVDLLIHNAWIGYCPHPPAIYRNRHSQHQFTAQTTLPQLIESYSLLISKLSGFLGVHWKEYKPMADRMESVFLFNLKRQQKHQHVSETKRLESEINP